MIQISIKNMFFDKNLNYLNLLKIYLNDPTNKNYKLDKIANFELLFYSCDIQNIWRKR